MDRKPSNRGFSLLEFSIMLFLTALMLGFSIPMFTQLFESGIRREALKFGQLLSNLRTQSILKSQSYQIIIDTAKNEYSVMVESPDTPGEYTNHENFGKPVKLPKPIRFYNVKRTEQEQENESRTFTFESFEFEKIIGEEFKFKIDSSGFIDTFDVNLRDDDSYITVSILDIMGRMEIGEEKDL
jgi:hypothetical protein